jgi:hypothetical protein
LATGEIGAMTGCDCPKGDIHLVEDTSTGLVYNSAFNTQLMEYDSAYQNEQGVSEIFQQHLQFMLNLLKENLPINLLGE